jgi:hypothetical protein
MDKKKYKKDQSVYTQARYGVVNLLGKQVFEWLQYQQFQVQKVTNPGGFSRLQPLQGAYRNERALYEFAQKNGNPISASRIHEIMGQLPNQSFNGKTFDQLTPLDMIQLDRIFGGNIPEMPLNSIPGGSESRLAPGRQVLFMNKEERIKCLLMIEDGLIQDGINSAMDLFMPVPYAIDKFGNIYATKNWGSPTHSFNHSTFNAGKEVICAGTLKVKQGGLTELDNASGHYKPTRLNLHNAAHFFSAAGVDMRRVKITVYEPAPGQPGYMIAHEYDNGDDFLRNPNAAPSRGGNPFRM